METDLINTLLLGLGLGLLHAFDSDHLLAVSVLSNERPGLRRCLNYSARWALGHGTVLMLAGAAVLGLHASMPASLSTAAEWLVGVLLIALGGHALWRQLRPGATRRGDQPTAPLLVGMVHGLAGSAPVLALLTGLSLQSWSSALLYLLLFSVGVLTSMTAFGLGLGNLQQWLAQRHQQLLQWCRMGIACSAIGLGVVWLGTN